MNRTFQWGVQIPFGDTDLAGIVHFPNYFKYMENCEHSFFRSLGFSIHQKGSPIGWPRKNCECDFKKPLYFEDNIIVSLEILEIRDTSIFYQFKITKTENDKEDILAAIGKIRVVCVSFDGNGGLKPCMIPDKIKTKIEEFQRSL